MKIDYDLANFDDVVMTALKTYDDVRYQNESDVNDWKLGWQSRSPYGFRVSCSNYIQTMDQSTRVDVSLKTPGTGRLNYSNTAITVPFFWAGEKNHEWSKMETIYNVFDYLIEFDSPLDCVVYSINEEAKFYNARERFTIGLLTYTRNPRVISALAGHPLVQKYRDGILIQLGDSIAALSDQKTDVSIGELREIIRAAGATDWLKL
jgi:hypothetical protein